MRSRRALRLAGRPRLDAAEYRSPDRVSGLCALQLQARIDLERLPELVTALGLLAGNAVDEGEVFVRARLRAGAGPQHRGDTIVGRHPLRSRDAADPPVGQARRRIPCVRVLAGEFRPLSWTLLPGTIIPDGADRDLTSAIDTDYHQNDLELLRLIGAVAAPEAGLGSSGRLSS